MAVVLWAVRAAGAQEVCPDLRLDAGRVVVAGVTRPVQATHAGDGSGRLFVVEQTGRIRVLREGELAPAPFLDLADRVRCCGEQGLLGLAFHPRYADNGLFYVNYTRKADGATVVARFSVDPANPDLADPSSQKVIFTVEQPFGNHNGGQLAFSPRDGFLYIGLGDGGSANDPGNRAQDPGSLLGKLLRLDVDRAAPYAVPPDNPFVGEGEPLDEIWALGLRNPWRFSFDRLTGDLFIGDVGQDAWEEIDLQPAGAGGANFGWRCREGAHDFLFAPECAGRLLVDPIAEYGHDQGNAVTGGFVYRGRAHPAMAGRYFYADYGTGKVWSLARAAEGGWSAPELELDLAFPISSFGEDEAGELYLVEYSFSGAGKVRRLVEVGCCEANADADPDLDGSDLAAAARATAPAGLGATLAGLAPDIGRVDCRR
ncbi:MAG: PQQ-dependent sugar dehydrogenase [Deferrisomatales bacterium]